MSPDSDFHPLMQIRAASLTCTRYLQHLKLADANILYQSYNFKGEIGQGAFGTVVEVVEKSTQKTWAMKIVQKSKVINWAELAKEIEILKFVNHPRIIYLHCIFETPKKMYMVLEKCQCSLEDLYNKRNPFSEKNSKTIIYDSADAVNYLHNNNIVHRDIKMQNILIAETPNPDDLIVKLTDFGLSVVKSGHGIANMMKQFCGTLFYMSPEILHQRAYSELCDIWSLGVIAYMLVFGRKPFNSRKEKDLIHEICNSEPCYTSNLKVNEKAKDLIKSMLSIKPENRITAALILEHPWIRKSKGGAAVTDYNVFNMMTKWKDEMKVESQKNWDLEDLIMHKKKSSVGMINNRMSDRMKRISRGTPVS